MEQILSREKNNEKLPDKIPESYLKAIFDSSRTYGLFTAYFDSELYHYAASYYKDNVFGCFRYMYSVLGIAKVLEEVEVSNRYSRNGMRHFLTENFCKISDDNQTVRKFGYCFTAKIEIWFEPRKTNGRLDLLSLSDSRARLYLIQAQRGGNGYIIHSHAGNLVMVAKADSDGRIILNLRGLEVRDDKNRNKRVPFWIDYEALAINGTVIFNALKPACHDEPCRYAWAVKAGEEIVLQVAWIPHISKA